MLNQIELDQALARQNELMRTHQDEVRLPTVRSDLLGFLVITTISQVAETLQQHRVELPFAQAALSDPTVMGGAGMFIGGLIGYKVAEKLGVPGNDKVLCVFAAAGALLGLQLSVEMKYFFTGQIPAYPQLDFRPLLYQPGQ